MKDRSVGASAVGSGAPEEHTGPRRSAPPGVEGVFVEVNLGAVVANARSVQELVGPSKRILAVLKADAYGHGMVQVARALERAQAVAGFVVTSVRDGMALRKEALESPIVVMACDYGRRHGAVLDAHLTPVLGDASTLEAFAVEARARGIRAEAHVEIDTGMSRLGVREEEVDGFLDAVDGHPEITVSGLCTHLASADDASQESAHRQLDAFERVSERFRAAGHHRLAMHASNTAALYRLPRSRFSHVRTGIALFGGDEPSGAVLRPAMRVTTHVAQLRSIGAGDAVSYGEKWRAERPSRIATLPIGYSTGLPRRAFGRAEVLVRGRRCPIVGSICMEMTMVDVTDVGAAVAVDDEVVLIGREGDEEIRVTELARATSGIVEEILCGIPKGARRTYLGAGPALVRDADADPSGQRRAS